MMPPLLRGLLFLIYITEPTSDCEVSTPPRRLLPPLAGAAKRIAARYALFESAIQSGGAAYKVTYADEW